MKLKICRDKKIACVLFLKHLGAGDYEIEWLETEKEYRGKGFAGQLIKRAMDYVKLNGNNLIGFLEPKEGLTYSQMVDWHKRLGFKCGRYDFGDWRGSNIKKVMIWTSQKKLNI